MSDETVPGRLAKVAFDEALNTMESTAPPPLLKDGTIERLIAAFIEPFDFAVFQTFGYKGLYGGLDRIGIQRRKGLKSKQNILDHMGSTELAANLFRATQTEEKLRREKIKGKSAANDAHYEVGRKVRQAIREIGGTMPEALPPAEDIAKVGRRLKRAISSSAKKLR